MLGGFSLSSPSGLLYVFIVIILLHVLIILFCVSSLFWLSLLFLFALFRVSVCFLFHCFLFSFSFFASFSSFLLFFLDLSFICFVLSSFFGFSFPPSSPLPSFPSSSFSFPFWFLLLSPLTPLSRLLSGLSLAFPSLPPLSSHPFSLFLFRLRFFPSTLFLPFCWLFCLLICPRCLFGEFLFFLFVFLAFGFRFLSVCVLGSPLLCVFSCWYFRSRGSPFVPVSLSSLLISRGLLLVPLLLLLSSSRLFLIFPIRCLFFLLFFYLVPSSRLSLRLLLPRLRSPSLIPLSSAFLSSAPPGRGGGCCLRRSDYVTWTFVGGLCCSSFRSSVFFFSPHFSWAPSCAFASTSAFFSALLSLPSSVPLLSIVRLLGSFLSPLLLCLSLRLLLPRLRSPSLITLSSAFLSSAPLGGGGGGWLRRSVCVT